MIITYDPKKDLRNWLRIKDKYSTDFTITQHYPFDKTVTLSRENFAKIVNSIKLEDIGRFNNLAKTIKLEWQQHEPKILEAIFKYLGDLPLINNYKVNLTSAYLMPYDERDNWFMVPTHNTLVEQIRCLAHELFHLYYIQKYSTSSLEQREIEVEKFLNSIVI